MPHGERWVYPRGLIDPPLDVEQPASPLRLYEKGVWHPAEQCWGEPDDMVEMCLVEVIAAGPRMQYEFEQLLPGDENPDPGDPILDAVELKNRGYPDRARTLLDGLVDWDARCIDAHAHLGGLAFAEGDIEEAQANYATGIRLAEASLPDGFGGVLGWGWIDNRPFLRCLHGLTISTWRLEQHAEAHELCQALLWLNPADNQGARELLPEIAAGAPWPYSR
jgi:tetratricopeptide (TPR) repeat protein